MCQQEFVMNLYFLIAYCIRVFRFCWWPTSLLSIHFVIVFMFPIYYERLIYPIDILIFSLLSVLTIAACILIDYKGQFSVPDRLSETTSVKISALIVLFVEFVVFAIALYRYLQLPVAL